MSVSLKKIAHHIEFWAEIKKKVISACVYPGLIFLMAIGVGAFMVFKIIPKFDEFLSKRGVPLPWSTNFVLEISRFCRGYWLLILILIVFTVSLLVLMFRHEKGRRLQERIILKIPILGKVIRNFIKDPNGTLKK